MKRTIGITAVAVAVVLVSATAALAAANVYLSGNDPTSCAQSSPAAETCYHPYGQVGKGDVQLAFGWNNGQLQTNVADDNDGTPRLEFAVDARDTYSAVCTFITGAGTPGQQTHNITIPRHVTFSSSITYKDKKHTQIDGFNLTGVSGTTTQGTVPLVGEACVANDEGVARNGTWSSVNLTGTTGDGLTVTWDADDSNIFGENGDLTRTIAGATINP